MDIKVSDDYSRIESPSSPIENIFFPNDKGEPTPGIDLYGEGTSVTYPLAKRNHLIMYSAIILALILVLKKKKSVGKIEKKDIINFIYVAGAVLGFSIIKKILEGLGIWKSAESKLLDSKETDPNSFWNPNYYQEFSSYSYAIDTAQANKMAEKIYDSFGMFNDCEECVKAVFFGLRTKANVSFLAKVFQEKYGQSLLPYLRGGFWPQDRLSDSDVAQINQFVSKLPSN